MEKQMIENNKCVYLHKLDGEVVYVGMGDIGRSHHKSGRTKEHRDVWSKLEVLILKDNLTKEEAEDLEHELIHKYLKEGCKLFNKRTVKIKTFDIKYEVYSKYLKYDETSSTMLRWIDHPYLKDRIGQEAGKLNSTGYWYLGIFGKELRQHRVIYSLCMKCDVDKNLVVDHIDGDISNNKIENLRLVTHRENSRNRLRISSNSSEYNVYLRLPYKDYIVRYLECVDGVFIRRQIHFHFEKEKRGSKSEYFATQEDAFKAAVAFRDELVRKGLIFIAERNK
jgi:hypothetical protein